MSSNWTVRISSLIDFGSFALGKAGGKDHGRPYGCHFLQTGIGFCERKNNFFSCSVIKGSISRSMALLVSSFSFILGKHLPLDSFDIDQCNCFVFLQHLPPNKIYHVTVMPCYDKKLEASRPDFFNQEYQTRDVDCVITTGKQSQRQPTSFLNWF